jgi:hypothetical protein
LVQRRRGQQWYGNLLLSDYGIEIFFSICYGIEIFYPLKFLLGWLSLKDEKKKPLCYALVLSQILLNVMDAIRGRCRNQYIKLSIKYTYLLFHVLHCHPLNLGWIRGTHIKTMRGPPNTSFLNLIRSTLASRSSLTAASVHALPLSASLIVLSTGRLLLRWKVWAGRIQAELSAVTNSTREKWKFRNPRFCKNCVEKANERGLSLEGPPRFRCSIFCLRLYRVETRPSNTLEELVESLLLQTLLP